MPRLLPVILSTLAFLTLAQCGPTVTTGTVAAPRATGAPQVVSAAEVGKLNALRAQYRLPGLSPDATLGRIAEGHARDMMQNGFFGHTSSNGNTIVQRAQAQGYNFCHVAENLAKGQSGFSTVLQQWMTSPSHRANVLHREVTGVAIVRAPGDLWVMVLGSRGC